MSRGNKERLYIHKAREDIYKGNCTNSWYNLHAPIWLGLSACSLPFKRDDLYFIGLLKRIANL